MPDLWQRIIACAGCGKVFAREHFLRHYCCEKCRWNAMNKKQAEMRRAERAAAPRILTCPQCGKDFAPVFSRQEYCCEACRNIARGARQIERRKASRRPCFKTCPQCGKKFERLQSAQRFCSEACQQAAQRIRRKRPPVTVKTVCKGCGKIFMGSPRRLFCTPGCKVRFFNARRQRERECAEKARQEALRLEQLGMRNEATIDLQREASARRRLAVLQAPAQPAPAARTAKPSPVPSVPAPVTEKPACVPEKPARVRPGCEPRACPVCGKVFTPQSPRRTYCSRACGGKAKGMARHRRAEEELRLRLEAERAPLEMEIPAQQPAPFAPPAEDATLWNGPADDADMVYGNMIDF